MTAILVRTARPGDHPTLQRIYRRASLSNEGDRAGLIAHPEFLQLDQQLIGRGRTRVATLADQTIIGFASTSPIGGTVLELDDLFVEPDCRRHGAARQLVQRIAIEAAAEGFTRIDVTANPHAMAFYRAVGFQGDEPIATMLGSGLRLHLQIEQPVAR